ncbi:MAG: hypothetical protein QM820_50475 [Minicystis sp.]
MMAMVLRRLWAATAAGALLAAPLATVGCGEGGGARTAQVSPGDMPSGAKWDGVYFSELYGFLHIKQSGKDIKGKWERPHKDKWGELKGEATGDVIKFEWSEYTRGLVGPNAKKAGKGYFKYKRPPGDNVDDTIHGEIGIGLDEVGEPWEGVKQRNLPPDLDSIIGSGAGDVGGGDWDSDSKEKGKPEAPASPR